MEAHPRDRLIETAARWYARLQAPDCAQEDRDEFAAWQAADPEHAQAFAAAQRLAEDVFETIAADERLRAMADSAFAMGTAAGDEPGHLTRGRSRRWFVPASVAAGVAVLAVLVWLTQASVDHAAGERFAAMDTRRDLALEDGTVVHLDIRSEIEVRLTENQRLVTLASGRAVFDVAHDAGRPFSVATDLGTVTALGTRFEVRRDRDATTVTLTEGTVDVAALDPTRPRVERLSPGEQLSVPADPVPWSKRQVDTDATTAWVRGRMIFRQTPLADALAEVNRYAAIKVRIADPSLADLPVSGSFIAGDSAAAVEAFAAVLPIRVADAGDELLLFERRSPRAE